MSMQMEQLARTFPILLDCPGTQPWSPEKLQAWATSHGASNGALSAARFLLSLWNPHRSWKCGRFNVMEAFLCWDDKHRQAFLQWANRPWWP